MTAPYRAAITLVVMLLAACSRDSLPTQVERPVMSEHKGWHVSVTPSFNRTAERWRARVEVWPPERRPGVHPGVRVHFDGSSSDRRAIEEAGTAAARRYIDDSLAVHR